MPSAAWETQKAVYSAIKTNPAVSGLVSGRVFDDTPDNYKIFPFVSIGEDVLTDFDTDHTTGQVVTLTIHVWSQYKGRKEVKNIQSAIYDVLHHGDLSIAGFNCIIARQVEETSFLEPDGIARHGVQTFELLISEA